MRTHRLLASVAVATLLTVTGAVSAGATSLVALTGHRTLLTIDYRKPAADSGDVELSDHGRLAIVDGEQGPVAGQCDEAGGFG